MYDYVFYYHHTYSDTSGLFSFRILYQISPVNGTNMLAILLDDTTCVAEESGGGKGGRDEIQLSEVALPCPCSYQRFRPSDPSICIHEFQLVSTCI